MAITVSLRLLAIAVLAVWTICQPAAAQRIDCRPGEPPFATTPANRMKGPELQAWLPGKRFVAVRPLTDSEQNTVRYGFQFRSDGSVVFTCSEPSGRYCVTFRTDSGARRDIGIWKIEGDTLVLTRTHHRQEGRAEGRLTIHRQGTVYAAARTPAQGPHLCLPGLLTIESGAS